MEDRFTPGQEAQLAEIAATAGTDPRARSERHHREFIEEGEFGSQRELDKALFCFGKDQSRAR